MEAESGRRRIRDPFEGTEPIGTGHIPALDGLRAAAVAIVCWYHIWQQSWLPPYIRGGIAKLFGKALLSFDFLPRTGYMLVDFMLLLSAFLLFLPYARAHLAGEPLPRTGEFWFRRARRILPSYWFCVLAIFFAYSLPAGLFAGSADAARELGLHMTFTQIFSPRAYLDSRINCVLWTVCVEMELYLVFPFLARLFLKRPDAVWMALTGLSHLFIYRLVLPDGDVRLLLNQFPAFLGVFANGMLAAFFLVRISDRIRHSPGLSLLAGACAALSLWWIVSLLKAQAGMYGADLQVSQLKLRFPLSYAFTALILGVTLGAKWLRRLLGCRPMRFLAGISFNLYMWHQWLAVRLKEWRIPYWSGDRAPNFTGDLAWQRKYTAICFGAALAAAVLTTYLVEKPGAKLLDLVRDGLAGRRALRAAAAPGDPDALPEEAFGETTGTEEAEKQEAGAQEARPEETFKKTEEKETGNDEAL